MIPKVGSLKAAVDDLRLAAFSLDNIPEFDTQMRCIEATHMAPLDPFQLEPTPLPRF
jgi:hypothetical protein